MLGVVVSGQKQTRIEQRAYALWQAEGQPDGRHEEHWQRAAREIETEETAGIAGTAPRAARRGRNSNRHPPHRTKKPVS
jgi:hypothetical protein